MSSDAGAAGAAGAQDTVAAATTVPPAIDDLEEAAGPSSGLRWFLRLASFVAMVLLGGIVVVAGWVWPRAWEQRRVRLLGTVAGLTLVVSSFGLLLALAADLDGGSMLGALGAVEDATRTDPGLALVIRVALSLVTLGVLLAWHPAEERTRWTVLGGLVVVGLGTWAMNGHARTMRWSWLGVPLDVVHYAAAAAWLGGLVVLSVAAFRYATTEELVTAMRRFSSVAAVSVVVIVATGAVQAVRLVGGPTGLLDSSHGRILLVKLLVLAGMLALADRNRRRVRDRFRTADAASPAVRGALRRSMGAEAVLGLAILGVTAALVVSSPGVSEPAPADITSEVTPADG
jgi:copper transport protein